MITSTSGGIMPSQDNKEYSDEDYIKTLRWLGWQYNMSLNNVPIFENGNFVSNGNVNTINEYVDNLAYVYGMQMPADYKFFAMDANGNNTRTSLVRGLDVYKIFNYLHGEAVDIIDPLPKILNVSAYSKDAISSKKNMMDYIKFQIQNKVFLKLLQEEAGYKFKAIDRDFESQEQVDKFFTNFQESMEIGYEQIARHVAYYNDYQQTLAKAFDYMTIGNLGCIEVEYENGQVRWNIVPVEEAIIDYTKKYDVHKDDDYGGRIFQMTVPDLLEAYEWTDKEIEDIKAIANSSNQAAQVYYNTLAATNVYWWSNNNGVPKVTVVKGQWRSLERGPNGERLQCLREGVLIGNKFLKENKISQAQVWDKANKAKKRLKYIAVTPNLFMGTSISVVGIIKRFANLKDAFITKMIDMAESSIGKATVIRASKLPEGMRTPDVISQLKQARVLVIEGEETEDTPTGAKLAESVDLTLDPNITLILNIVQYLDNVINDYLNIPASVRGLSSTYQSAKGIETTQTQSSKGLSYLFKTFQIFMRECLSYSADLMKLLAPEDELGRDSLSLIVGDDMVELLSMDVVRKSQFEDFLLSLNPTDYNSVEEKNQLMNLVMQTATSGAPAKILKNYFIVKNSESLTEAENKIDALIYKEEMAEKQRQEQEMQMAQMQAQQNNAAQMGMAELNAQAGLEKAAMSEETKRLALLNKGGGNNTAQ